MNFPAQNRNWISILAVLVIGFSAVYTIPYYIPIGERISYSYLLGFNNRAAVFLLLSLIVLFAVWSRGLGLSLPDLSKGPSLLFRRTGYIAIFCAIFCGALMWVFSSAIIPLAESQYFLDRHELYRMGERLYRDFGFYYGPIMFYLPVWIGQLFHLSPGNSQYAAWIFEWALGTWVLWKTVQMAARGTERGHTIFLLLWVCWMLGSMVSSGSNYTPLRCFSSLWVALEVHQLYTRGTSILLTFGIAAVGTATILLYSAEQGIALTAATFLFFLICVRKRRPGTLAGLALFTTVVSAALAVAYRMGALDSVRSIGGGALNFPLVVSFQTIVLMLMLVIAGCIVFASFRNHVSDHPLVYLVCLSLVTLPAAFSRADDGHILSNTLGALIAVLIVLSQYPTAWRLAVWSFVILGATLIYHLPVSGLVLNAAFTRQYHSPLAERIVVGTVRLVKGKNAEQYLDWLRPRHTFDPDPNRPSLAPHTYFYAPMGVRRRLQPFEGDPQIYTGRYVLPMISESFVSATIADIETHPDWPILLPTMEATSCGMDPETVRQVLRTVLVAPYIPKVKNNFEALIPLCAYLNSHYKPTNYNPNVPDYYVWMRNGYSIDQRPMDQKVR